MHLLRFPSLATYQMLSAIIRAFIVMQTTALSDLRIHIDGPFGAPAVAYSRFKVVLLVATGVGVTPFMSMVCLLMTEPDTRTE